MGGEILMQPSRVPVALTGRCVGGENKLYRLYRTSFQKRYTLNRYEVLRR
jgi:hypothetical protein